MHEREDSMSDSISRPLGQIPNHAIISTYHLDGDPESYTIADPGDEITPGLLRQVLPDGRPVMSEDGITPVGRIIHHDSVVFIVGFIEQTPGGPVKQS